MLLDIVLPSIVITMINLLVLFFLLRWLLWRPVSEFLEKRRQKVASDIDTARRNKEESEELLARHRQLLEEGRQEAAGIIDAAARQAEARSEDIIRQARQEAEQIVKRAHTEIQRQRDKAVEELRQEVSVLAVTIAEKMLTRAVEVPDQQQYFRQALEELGENYGNYSS